MINPTVALFRWIDANEKNNEHISCEKSLNSTSNILKLVGGQHDLITMQIFFLCKENLFYLVIMFNLLLIAYPNNTKYTHT